MNVAAGAELRGIDVRLPKEKAFPIRGTVEGPAEAFQRGGRVQLFLTGSFNGVQIQQSAAQDGSFTFDMIKPGAYVIDAWYNAAYWGRQEITVKDAPVEGVTVRLQPTMEISGRIEIEAGDGSVAKPQGQIKVQLSPNSPGPFIGIPHAAGDGGR